MLKCHNYVLYILILLIMHIFYCNRNRASRGMYVNVQCGLISDPETWHSVWGKRMRMRIREVCHIISGLNSSLSAFTIISTLGEVEPVINPRHSEVKGAVIKSSIRSIDGGFIDNMSEFNRRLSSLTLNSSQLNRITRI